MPPDYIEPFPRAVMRDALEYLIGRPISETELDFMARQMGETHVAGDLLLAAMKKKGIEYLGVGEVIFRGKEFLGPSLFHSVLLVRDYENSRRKEARPRGA